MRTVQTWLGHESLATTQKYPEPTHRSAARIPQAAVLMISVRRRNSKEPWWALLHFVHEFPPEFFKLLSISIVEAVPFNLGDFLNFPAAPVDVHGQLQKCPFAQCEIAAQFWTWVRLLIGMVFVLASIMFPAKYANQISTRPVIHSVWGELIQKGWFGKFFNDKR